MSFFVYLLVLAVIAFTVAHFTTLGKYAAKYLVRRKNNVFVTRSTRATLRERYVEQLPNGTVRAGERFTVQDSVQFPKGSVSIHLPQYQQTHYTPDEDE